LEAEIVKIIIMEAPTSLFMKEAEKKEGILTQHSRVGRSVETMDSTSESLRTLFCSDTVGLDHAT
jgi:hypothetical protein